MVTHLVTGHKEDETPFFKIAVVYEIDVSFSASCMSMSNHPLFFLFSRDPCSAEKFNRNSCFDESPFVLNSKSIL